MNFEVTSLAPSTQSASPLLNLHLIPKFCVSSKNLHPSPESQSLFKTCILSKICIPLILAAAQIHISMQ